MVPSGQLRAQFGFSPMKSHG